MSQIPNSQHGNYVNNDDAERSCQREMEQLATSVSEMALKSPTEKPPKPPLKQLSVNAAEFVPSWMKSQLPQQVTTVDNSANISATNNSFEAATATANLPMSAAEISQYLLSDIRMYVAHLRDSPASFNDMAMIILDLLINYAYDDNILAAAIDEIFRTGLEYENFSYQCARLCGFLATNYWGFGGVNPSAVDTPTATFRALLLKRCREEHEARMRGPLPCLYNYGLLLADLYNQIKVEDKNVLILGNAVIAIVNALLDQPNDGNVACAVRILKCCGVTLESSERLQHGGGDHAPTPALDKLFYKFNQLLQSDAYGLSDDGKTLIRNLITNRGDWHKYAAEPDDSNEPPPPAYDRCSSDTVFFGPDGEALTAEETAFLEQELGAFQSSSSGEEDSAYAAMLSAEDDGIDEAYEQFLRMTEEKRKQQQKN